MCGRALDDRDHRLKPNATQNGNQASAGVPTVPHECVRHTELKT